MHSSSMSPSSVLLYLFFFLGLHTTTGLAHGYSSVRRGLLAAFPTSPLLISAPAVAQPPLVGRFEPLKGALSFIGRWEYTATVGPSGELRFLKSGDVELVDTGSQSTIAVSASPWKYESSKAGDEEISISFTLDVDDVFILSGSLDSMGGPGRLMKGIVETGRAEIGARGGGPREKIGEFTARSIGF